MTDYFKDLAAGKQSKETADLITAYVALVRYFLERKESVAKYADDIAREIQERIAAAGVADMAAVYERARNILSRNVYAYSANIAEVVTAAKERRETVPHRFTYWNARRKQPTTIKDIKAAPTADGQSQARAEMAARYPGAVEIPAGDLNAACYMLWLYELTGANASGQEVLKLPTTPALNVFTELKRHTIDQKTEVESAAGTAIVLDNGNGLTLSIPIEKYSEAALKNPNTDKLYKQIALEVARTKDRTFFISGKDFMKARGLKDSKEAQKQAKAALTALAIPLIEYDGGKGGKMGSVALDHIVGYAEMHGFTPGKGKAWYIAGEVGRSVYAHILYASDKYIKQFPAEILTIPNNRQTEYIIVNAFVDARRNGAGQRNENILSVATLLEKCSHIASYDSLKEKGIARKARERIITPLINALNYLQDEQHIFTYRFQEPGGNVYKSGQFEAWENDYSKFITLMVAVEWAEPYQADQTHLIEQREKQAKKASKKKTPAKE